MTRKSTKILSVVVLVAMALSLLQASAFAFSVSNEITVNFAPVGVIVHNTAELLTALADAKAATPRTASDDPFVILMAGDDDDAFSGSQFVIDSDYVTIMPLDRTVLDSAVIKYTGYGASVETVTRPFNGALYDGLLLVNGATGVVIDGITVDGDESIVTTGGVNNHVGILVYESDATITGVTVENFIDLATPGMQNGFGIFVVSAVGSANVVDIKNSTITNIQKGNVFYEGGVSGDFTGNIVTSHAVTAPGVATSNGLQYGRGSVVNATGNTFTDFRRGAATAAACMYVPTADNGANDNLTVTGNTYVNCEYHFVTYGVALYALSLEGVTPDALGVVDLSSTVREVTIKPTVTKVETNEEAFIGWAYKITVEVISGNMKYDGDTYTPGDTFEIAEYENAKIEALDVAGGSISVYVDKPMS